MSDAPLFSILTVTWNDQAGLRATVESVASQTWRDLEHLVVDGASTDGSRQYLESLGTDGPAWTSEPDDGIYDAMNRALDRARGRYVLFLNAGDPFEGPEVLAQLAAALEEEAWPDLLYGDSILETLDGREMLKPCRPFHPDGLAMPARHQAILFSRSAIGDLRHDLSFPVAADKAFFFTFTRRLGPEARVAARHLVICRYPEEGFCFHQWRQHLEEEWRFLTQVQQMGRLPAAAYWTYRCVAILTWRFMPGVFSWVRLLRRAVTPSVDRPHSRSPAR